MTEESRGKRRKQANPRRNRGKKVWISVWTMRADVTAAADRSSLFICLLQFVEKLQSLYHHRVAVRLHSHFTHTYMCVRDHGFWLPRSAKLQGWAVNFRQVGSHWDYSTCAHTWAKPWNRGWRARKAHNLCLLLFVKSPDPCIFYLLSCLFKQLQINDLKRIRPV